MGLANAFKTRKVQALLVLLALSFLLLFARDGNLATVDANFGIEFIGGVRIPISLERSVDAATMGAMVDTIKARINKLGLSQAVVRPLGDREIIVEVPRAAPETIRSVERILREQGRFEAVVGGAVGLTGADVLTNAVGGAQGERVVEGDGTTSWELDFSVTREGGERFSQAALGKGNFPVYMFLDRPENAVVIVPRDAISDAPGALDAVQDALAKDGDDLLLLYEEEFDADAFGNTLADRRNVVVGNETLQRNAALAAFLTEKGYVELVPGAENVSKRLVVRGQADMAPVFSPGAQLTTRLTRWPAIGLLSAPVLSPSLADGYVSQFYSVSGAAAGATAQEQRANAIQEIRELKSVISGGRLPVSTSVGSSFSITAGLGEQFLAFSAFGLFAAMLVVAALIVVRYRKPILAVPIVLVNASETFILAAVIGTIGTIDLGAMAGIITLIGSGVDDQLIITDEMLKKKRRADGAEGEEEQTEGRLRERLGRAFNIVVTNAGVAVVAMLPLLLSGIVEITGFALATMLGVIIGVSVTRPAFGELIKEIVRRP